MAERSRAFYRLIRPYLPPISAAMLVVLAAGTSSSAQQGPSVAFALTAPVSLSRTASLPDAPGFVTYVAVDPQPVTPAPVRSQRETDLACQSGALHGRSCRAHWIPILWQSFEITAAENLGNIGFDAETRHDLVTNPYWSTYVKCVKQFRYDQWRDDDDFMVDYVAHGLQGAIVSYIFEQNSPTGRGLVYVNNGNYWRSRLKGMAWSAVYEVQWKIGPASEASIGNSGLNTYFTPRVKGRSTNETGFQDFVDTPVIGFGWNIGEDALDRFLMPKIWGHTHNKWVLAAASVMTPSKAAANMLRYKPPYYRDFPITPLR